MFLRREHGTPLAGRLVYSEAEYSFRYDVALPADLLELAGGPDLASVSIGTLQIEVGVASHRALFAWGLHPRARWSEARLPNPVALAGVAILGPEVEYSAGISISLSGVGEWATIHDVATGWVRISASPYPEDEVITIATGVLLGTTNNELTSVWLKPEFE